MLLRPVSPHIAPETGHNPNQRAEDDDLHRDTLHELIGIGTDLARLTHQQAVAQAQAAAQGAPAAPLEGHVIAFDRTARAIRRCITLARSLHEPPPPTRAPAPPRAAHAHPLREAGDAAGHPSATPADAAEAPGTDQRDRPERPDRDDTRDGPDRDDDDTGRPVAAVIADICRDLAVAAPPGAGLGSRTPAGMEQPCAGAAARSGAAPSTARQPGPWPHGPGPRDKVPQASGHGAPQPGPDPQPDTPQPGGQDQPAASPHAPGPAHAGPAGHTTPPDTPAEAAASALHRHAQAQARWRPPPPS